MIRATAIGKFYKRHHKWCIAAGIILAVLSCFAIPQLQFKFSFEQFFPEDDPDLAFYKKYIEKFESDDNFMLIAIENTPSIYDSVFLDKYGAAVDSLHTIEDLQEIRSLKELRFPVLNPMTGIGMQNPININSPPYGDDSIRIANDERLIGTFVTEEHDAIITYLETVENINLQQSNRLMRDLERIFSGFSAENYHYLGRAYFQAALPDFQTRELLKISIISALLILFITAVVFRRIVPVLITLSTIGVGLLVFMAFIWVSGQTLNFMAAIYPLIMIIVGTSDIIHIMTKYIKEIKKGKSRQAAIGKTLHQIGLATFLTSVTTAAGFASLFTSKLGTIQGFGINAAIGVFIAFIIAIFFSSSLLYISNPTQLLRKRNNEERSWSGFLRGFNRFTGKYQTSIIVFAVGSVIMLIFGVSRVQTNTAISYVLPQGEKITKDFVWFEQNLAGFRPVEYAVMPEDSFNMKSPRILLSINKLEKHLNSYDEIENVSSQTLLYKSINRLLNGNRPEAYKMPTDTTAIRNMQPYISQLSEITGMEMFKSRDNTMGRISGRVTDVGSDSFRHIQNKVNHWINNNIDTSIVDFRATGTGVIFDKNAAYVRSSLLRGLVLALVIVSIILSLLFQSFKMIIISIIPNLIPLLFAGAMMSLFNIQLEAGATIVFAVIFGLAVDDTIHFISKYKLAFMEYGDREKALEVTFEETGQALVITSLILFAGFAVLLFSVHLPTRVVGMLISTTIVSALAYDLLLIPVLIRLLKADNGKSIVN